MKRILILGLCWIAFAVAFRNCLDRGWDKLDANLATRAQLRFNQALTNEQKRVNAHH